MSSISSSSLSSHRASASTAASLSLPPSVSQPMRFQLPPSLPRMSPTSTAASARLMQPERKERSASSFSSAGGSAASFSTAMRSGRQLQLPQSITHPHQRIQLHPHRSSSRGLAAAERAAPASRTPERPPLVRSAQSHPPPAPRRPSPAIGNKRRRAQRRDRGDTDDYQDDEDDGGGDSYRDDEDDGYGVDSFHPRKYPRHLTYPETSQLSHHAQAYALVPLLSQSQQTFSQPPSFNTGGGGGWDQQLSQLPPLYGAGNGSHYVAPVGGWMPSATQFPSQQPQEQQQQSQQQQHPSVPCLPPSVPLGREYAAAPAAPSFGGMQQPRLYHLHQEQQQQQQQQRHFAGPPPNITFDAAAQAEFTSHNRIYAPLPLMFEPSQQRTTEQIQQQQRQQQQQHYLSAASSASSAQYRAAVGQYAPPQYAGQQVPTMSLSMLQPPPAVAPRQHDQLQHLQLSQQTYHQHPQLQQHQQQAHSQQQFQPSQQQLVPFSADSASVATVLAPLSRDLLSKTAVTSAAAAQATAASTMSSLSRTASPLSSRSSASSRSSSSASEGGNSSTGTHKKRRRDVHLLHRDFALHERLVTRDNHQFGHHSVYSWAADETVATVEESTRAAHKIRKVKQTFLEDHERSGRRGGEMAGNRRLDQQIRSARGGFVTGMRVCAIVYKEQPPEEIDEDANEGDGLKEEERGRERPLRHVTSRHFAPPPPPPPPRAQHAVANITQYVTTGPILLDPSTMPAGHNDFTTAKLFRHLQSRISLPFLVRLATFLETETPYVAAHVLLTYALLCLERVHDALELESLQSRPANSQLVSIVQSRFRTNAAGECGDSARLQRRYHEQRVHDSRMAAGELLSLNDVSWIERHLFELRRAWRSTPDVLFLTCAMLSVKFLDDFPKSTKLYVRHFPEANRAQLVCLERAVLILLDSNIFVTDAAFKRKLEEVKQIF